MNMRIHQTRWKPVLLILNRDFTGVGNLNDRETVRRFAERRRMNRKDTSVSGIRKSAENTSLLLDADDTHIPR